MKVFSSSMSILFWQVVIKKVQNNPLLVKLSSYFWFGIQTPTTQTCLASHLQGVTVNFSVAVTKHEKLSETTRLLLNLVV